jgi:hypothetical protein
VFYGIAKYIGIRIYIHTPFYFQPEDDSKKPKHVVEIFKFINYLIKCIRI